MTNSSFSTLLSSLLMASAGLADAPVPKPAAVVPEEPAPILRLEAGGPTAYVTALAFSPAGKKLYAAGFDKVIRVWKLNERTGQFALEPAAYRIPIGPGQRGVINVLAVSPDGAWLAASGRGVFRQGAGFSAPGRVVEPSAQTPEMRKDQATIYLFQTQTQAVRILRGHEGYVLRLAFAPAQAGKPPLLVSAAQEPAQRPGQLVGRICLWDISKAAYRDDQGALVDPAALVSERILPEKPHANVGLSVVHTGSQPNQVRVAIAWSDGALRIWDPEQNGQAGMMEVADGLAGWNNMTAWISRSDFLTGSVVQQQEFTGGRLQIWNEETGQKPEPRRSRELQPPEGYKVMLPRALGLFAARPGGGASHAAVVVRVQSANNQADEYWLLTLNLADLSVLNTIYLWNRSAGEPALATTTSGRHLAVAGRNDHAVLVYEIADLLRGESKPQALRSIGITARSIAFVEKGKDLGLFLSESAAARTGGVADMKPDDLVLDPAKRSITPDPASQGWKFTSATSDGWQVQGGREASRTQDGKEVDWLFDWQGPNDRGQVNLKLAAKEAVTGQTLLPPSKISPVPILAVASWDREVSQPTLRLVDATTGTPIRELTGHTRPIVSLAATRDGKLLASAGEDQTVCLWSLVDLPRIYRQHGTVNDVILKPVAGGLLVESIKQGGLAGGKLEAGDLIEGLLPKQGAKLRPLTSSWEFYEALWDQKPGQNVDLQIQRQGAKQSVSLRIEQGIDERKPLLSLFVVEGDRNQPREWIAWTPIGPYDSSSEKVERYLGWQFNPRQLEEPVKFAFAEAYRNQFREPRLLAPLLAHADIRETLREIKPAVPKPDLEMEVEAPGARLDAEEGAEQILRSPVATLRLKLKGPSFEQNQVDSIVWRIDGQPAQAFDLEKASGQRLSAPLHLLPDRRAHSIRVHLRTRETAPQEATAEMKIRYLPPPPRIEFDKDWLRREFGQAEELRKSVRSAAFSIQAKAVAALADTEVEVALQQNHKPPLPLTDKIDQRISLQQGLNTLTLLARNKGALPELDELETARQALVLLYEKPETPQVMLQAVEPIAEHAARQPIEPGKVVTVSASRVRVIGKVKSTEGIQRVEIRNARGDRLPEARVDNLEFSAELTLLPGEQEFRFQARAADSESAEMRLPVKYLPVLPLLAVTEPLDNMTVTNEVDQPEVGVKGVLTAADEFHPFHVEIQVNNQAPIQVPFKDQKAVVDGSAQTLAKVRLQPGENVVQVQVKSDWRQGPVTRRHVFYRRPPRILGEIAINPEKKKAFAELRANIESSADLPLTRISVNDRQYEPKEVARVEGNEKQRTSWAIRVERVALQPGHNTLRLAVQNADGAAAKEATLDFQPLPLKLPEFVVGDRQITTSVPEYALHFRVMSESRLQAVELRQENQVLKSFETGKQNQNNRGVFELEAACTVALTPGASGNSFRLVAANEDGEARDEVTVSYVPPAVQLLVARPPSQAEDAHLQLKGAVAFRTAKEARRDHSKLEQIRVYVNDFLQRPVTLAPVGIGSNQVEFTADIVLNQPANKIAVECPADLHLEAGAKRDREEFTVACAAPVKPATLHLLVVAVDVRDRREQEKLVQQAFSALQADYHGSPSLRSTVFKEVIVYPPPGPRPRPLAGTVTRGQVRTVLSMIRRAIVTRGSPSDVVLIYWLGRGAEKEQEEWYLPTYTSAPGEKLSDTGVSLRDLLGADEATSGARLLLLDVAPSTSEEMPVANLSTAHTGILRYRWSQPGVPVPGLLVALEKAALRRGAASVEDVILAASELRRTHPRSPELKHNLQLLPTLAGLIVTQRP